MKKNCSGILWKDSRYDRKQKIKKNVSSWIGGFIQNFLNLTVMLEGTVVKNVIKTVKMRVLVRKNNSSFHEKILREIASYNIPVWIWREKFCLQITLWVGHFVKMFYSVCIF